MDQPAVKIDHWCCERQFFIELIAHTKRSSCSDGKVSRFGGANQYLTCARESWDSVFKVVPSKSMAMIFGFKRLAPFSYGSGLSVTYFCHFTIQVSFR